MKIHMYEILKEPVITEKAAAQANDKLRKYTFSVHPKSNKKQIKSAVEKIFNVHVEKVNTSNHLGKWRRVRYEAGKTPQWKKAVVTLKEGEKIDVTA